MGVQFFPRPLICNTFGVRKRQSVIIDIFLFLVLNAILSSISQRIEGLSVIKKGLGMR